MQIKFKKTHPDAVAPIRATDGAAGWDLTCCRVSNTAQWLEYHTEIAVEIPPGYVGLMFPRSSVRKKGLSMANCVGVIDSDYRGPLVASFYWASEFAGSYMPGDRVCQLVIMPLAEVEQMVEVDELSETVRGEGGHGSTGN